MRTPSSRLVRGVLKKGKCRKFYMFSKKAKWLEKKFKGHDMGNFRDSQETELGRDPEK